MPRLDDMGMYTALQMRPCLPQGVFCKMAIHSGQAWEVKYPQKGAPPRSQSVTSRAVTTHIRRHCGLAWSGHGMCMRTPPLRSAQSIETTFVLESVGTCPSEDWPLDPHINALPRPEKLQAHLQASGSPFCFEMLDGRVVSATFLPGETWGEKYVQEKNPHFKHLFQRVVELLAWEELRGAAPIGNSAQELENEKMLRYTHTSTLLKHSTSPLDDTTNATRTHASALSLQSHPGLCSSRVGPGQTPTVHTCPLRWGGSGWLIHKTTILTEETTSCVDRNVRLCELACESSVGGTQRGS